MQILDVTVLAACAAAACSDILTKRIPNVIPLTLMVAALLIHASAGLPSLAASLLTMTLIVVAGYFLFSFRLIGGGDVKLMAAAGGAFAFPQCVYFLLFTMLAGGVLGLAVAAWRGHLKASADAVFAFAQPLLYRTGLDLTLPAVSSKMPYGVAIFSGALLAVFKG